MNAVVSLLGIYLRRPTLAIDHLGKAFRIASSDGPRALIARARTLANARFADRKRLEEQARLHRSLSLLTKNALKNRKTLIDAMLPFASDLSVLDVVHDESERHRLITCHILKKYSLFDEEFYAGTYLGNIHSIRPIDHYIRYGLAGGLRPNAYFDPTEYFITYPDVAAIGMDSVIHYALFGWKEGRSAGSLFDGKYYLKKNPDVAESGASPLHHFLALGRGENRAPTNAFSLGKAQNAIGGLTAKLARSAGTIIIVSHDAELGGAQQVVRVFAKWLLDSTGYDVKLVTMRGGAFAHSFREIADTFDVAANAAGSSESEVAEKLRQWAGPDVKAVFINSIASGGFLNYWREDTPIVAFIHELPKILKMYEANVRLLKDRATTIIGGSEAVKTALHQQFEIEPERLEVVYGFIESLAKTDLVDFEDKKAAKHEMGLEDDAFVVAGCGVLHWRKSPDKFIEVAEKVVARHGPHTQFVWIGGGPDLEQCERLVVAKGLEKNVRFTGYEPNIMRYLKATDVFLLPSEEDPFPLVCLYAASAAAPVVCFEEAGGMPEFVAQGCGRAVPFGDVEAMAAAVLEYATDRELRETHGETGRQVVQAGYTIRTTGPQLLHHIREAAGLTPAVSVIVPNYNYEKYLPERLESIANQSFQDFEVILLDDKSPDHSVSLLQSWARKRPGTRLVVNEKNSGSPFVQWFRGIDLAKSELIWIAEADDACEPNFLETLLPFLEDRNVALAFVKSVPIGADGKILGDYEDLYLNRIAQGRWSRSYIASDYEEVNEALGIANSIPNASSVVFRRFEAEPEIVESLKAMRMCGDWYFYLRAIRGALVAYSSEPLNFHRRHGQTVTSQTEGSKLYFYELATIRSYINRTYELSKPATDAIAAFTVQDLDRFGITDKSERVGIIESTRPIGQPMLAVLFVASDLSPGGGQMFTIRMANEWARRGGRAILLNVQQYETHPKVVAQIDPRLTVFHVAGAVPNLREIVGRFGLDLIHSSIWWGDRYVLDNIEQLEKPLPWVVTMHGCHETHLDNPLIDNSFPYAIPKMLSRVDAWVYLADKNKRVFAEYGDPKRLLRIGNGTAVTASAPISRKQLGLRKDAVVLCLVSRAIAEKGWPEAVALTKRLNGMGHKVDLLLVGDGPVAEQLRVNKPKHVHLAGQVSNPQDYMRIADIGLLPSSFVGESMPLVILEMFGNGLPVISTNVGEIPQMIGEGADAAGIVVPLRNQKVDMDKYVEAVISLLDEKRRQAVGAAAKARFDRDYTMEKMVDAYQDLYEKLTCA